VDDHITFGTRIAESSPLIVLILLLGYIFLGRFIMSLIARMDRKDEQIVKMNVDMVGAIGSMQQAVERLTDALHRADRN